MQRTTQKCHMAPDGLTAGQTGDGLIDYGLEYGHGKIGLGSALVDQWLDIRLGKYAATGSDGIDGIIGFCIFIQSGCVGHEKSSHLVDEGACTAGADGIHALFDAAFGEVDDLCVLAAQLDGYIGLGRSLLQGAGYTDYLLLKGNVDHLCQGQSAGTGDVRSHLTVADLPDGFFQELLQRLLDPCEMTLIFRKKQVVFFVDHSYLYGSGTDVNA